MITTLAALAAVCLLSLAFILIIPHFAATKVLMRFLPRDIREAAKAHPDPPAGKRMIGYLITALAAAGYAGVFFFLGADGVRRGYGFWLRRCGRGIWSAAAGRHAENGADDCIWGDCGRLLRAYDLGCQHVPRF